MHELADLLHHRSGDPRGNPQRLGLLVLAEHRRAVLVAKEPHQVEAGVLAIEVEHIPGGGNPQPHPPELRELERVRHAEREEGSPIHGVAGPAVVAATVIGPVHWKLSVDLTASSIDALIAALVTIAEPVTWPF